MGKRPNILFMLSDQHSPHVLGCGGNGTVNTPSLDRLAKEGVYFEQAYCQNPLCVPSRASLLTGRYSRSLGIYDNMHVMQANSTTIPRTLAEAGYRTCLIGKSHFNGEQYHGYQQRPYGDLYGQGHQPDPARLPEFGINGLGDVLENSGVSEIPVALTQTEICVAEASKWMQAHIGANPEQPFLLSVHFDKPHFPIKAPQQYCEKYKGMVDLQEVPDEYLDNAVPFIREAIAHNETGHHYGRDHEMQRNALEAYYGCVEWVDNAVGRLIDVLDYLGLSEDTIVVYASDHGEMGGEHGTWQKTLFFDASSRVPLIIRGPGRFLTGLRSGEIVGLVDLFPTLCEAAGIKIPETCEGVSLMPLLESGGKIMRSGIFCESAVLRATEHAGCMYRTGEWKYCRYLDGYEELYNMKEDPDEWDNVVKKHEGTDFLADLRIKTDAFWKPGEYLDRLKKTPIMSKEKHFYPYSNQFILGNGLVVDARP